MKMDLRRADRKFVRRCAVPCRAGGIPVVWVGGVEERPGQVMVELETVSRVQNRQMDKRTIGWMVGWLVEQLEMLKKLDAI
ncbi:unnamed protein product [Ceratitis capitata]|uniref:(Mediterranean fruit fly) hypothetical protein n=1 Tax=Ceratitis capitata TaxID=7213 RepID=A0A811UH02_CERCA|nr:unnamed protein product [Ceratitis capitata]